jgi:hypothetical protein
VNEYRRDTPGEIAADLLTFLSDESFDATLAGLRERGDIPHHEAPAFARGFIESMLGQSVTAIPKRKRLPVLRALHGSQHAHRAVVAQYLSEWIAANER